MMDKTFVIDDALITHIAKLAKINIDSNEMQKIKASLKDTLALAQEIQNVEGVVCPYTVSSDAWDVSALPEDSSEPNDHTEAFEHSLAHFKNGLFHVPAFIED